MGQAGRVKGNHRPAAPCGSKRGSVVVECDSAWAKDGTPLVRVRSRTGGSPQHTPHASPRLARRRHRFEVARLSGKSVKLVSRSFTERATLGVEWSKRSKELFPTMGRLIGHLILWLITLAAFVLLVLLLGTYLFVRIEPVTDKPLAAVTLKELTLVGFFLFLVACVPAMLFKLFAEMIEDLRWDFDFWRSLRRRIKCPRCGELAWNDDTGSRCPYCGWLSDNPYEEPTQ